MPSTPWIDTHERRLLRQRRRHELALIAELVAESAFGRDNSLLTLQLVQSDSQVARLSAQVVDYLRDNRRLIAALQDLRAYCRRVEADNDRLYDELDRMTALNVEARYDVRRELAPQFEEVSDSDSDIIDLTTPYILSILPSTLFGFLLSEKDPPFPIRGSTITYSRMAGIMTGMVPVNLFMKVRMVGGGF